MKRNRHYFFLDTSGEIRLQNSAIFNDFDLKRINQTKNNKCSIDNSILRLVWMDALSGQQKEADSASFTVRTKRLVTSTKRVPSTSTCAAGDFLPDHSSQASIPSEESFIDSSVPIFCGIVSAQ
jgi:hypothetical protein